MSTESLQAPRINAKDNDYYGGDVVEYQPGLDLLGDQELLNSAIAFMRQTGNFPLNYFPQAVRAVQTAQEWYKGTVSVGRRVKVHGVWGTIKGEGKEVDTTKFEKNVLGADPILQTESMISNFIPNPLQGLIGTSIDYYSETPDENKLEVLREGSIDRYMESFVYRSHFALPSITLRHLEAAGIDPYRPKPLRGSLNELIRDGSISATIVLDYNRRGAGEPPAVNASDILRSFLVGITDLLPHNPRTIFDWIHNATFDIKQERDGVKKRSYGALRLGTTRQEVNKFRDTFDKTYRPVIDSFREVVQDRHSLLIQEGYGLESFLRLFSPGNLVFRMGDRNVTLSDFMKDGHSQIGEAIGGMFSTLVDVDSFVTATQELIEIKEHKYTRPLVSDIAELGEFIDSQNLSLQDNSPSARRELFYWIYKYLHIKDYLRLFDQLDLMNQAINSNEDNPGSEISTIRIPDELRGVAIAEFSSSQVGRFEIEETEDLAELKARSEKGSMLGNLILKKSIKDETGEIVRYQYLMSSEHFDNLAQNITEGKISKPDANVVLYPLLRSLGIVGEGDIIDITKTDSVSAVLGKLITLKNIGTAFLTTKGLDDGLRFSVDQYIDFIKKIEPIFSSRFVGPDTATLSMSTDVSKTDLDDLGLGI